MDNNYKIHLASENDLFDIFTLSNDPVVRANSFSQAAILFEDHKKWFAEKIKSNNCVFFVIKDGFDNFIGYVRFDANQNDVNTHEYIISIHLAENARGR